METYEMIRQLRIERGLSQDELASLVGYKDRSSVAKVEAGKVDLSQTKVAAFAKALGVTPAYLLGLSPDATPSLPSNILPIPTPVSESGATENVVKLAGRDGSYMEKRVSDEQLALFQTMLDQMKPVDDESI